MFKIHFNWTNSLRTKSTFFILLGLFLIFDGRVARLRNKSSLMGQELDSLADLVSFGVSPATIAFAIGFRTTVDVLFLAFWVLCGLTRLARFNISVNNIPKDKHGKSQYFEGLPIPTNLFWVGFMALLVYKDWIHDNLPFGIVFQDTLFEFHLVTIGFVLQGCAEISKSLKFLNHRDDSKIESFSLFGIIRRCRSRLHIHIYFYIFIYIFTIKHRFLVIILHSIF